MSSRDDVEAEEVVNNPGGAANDPGETFDLIRIRNASELAYQAELGSRSEMIYKLAYQAELGN